MSLISSKGSSGYGDREIYGGNRWQRSEKVDEGVTWRLQSPSVVPRVAREGQPLLVLGVAYEIMS
jgi:hypothetical protein